MISYIVVAVLLVFSALFSGLNLGLMSLSPAELKRKISLGNKDAKKVYPIRREGNLLLTTLLVGNVAINSALAIFLGSIASGFVAGLIATGSIVIFGEIIPQAIFSRYALSLGAKTAWIVKIFIFVLYPITAPIAWVLNKTLGAELLTIYSKKELVKIVEEHGEAQDSEIDEDEERIVRGALSFSDKTVEDIMTPRTVMTALEFSQEINKDLIDTLGENGHSRIPVYKEEQDKIVGMLYLTQLIGMKNLGKTVGQVAEKKVFFVDENEKLDDVFNKFLRIRHHLFVVRNEFNEVVGVVTLEDVIEEIIDNEIMDEVDKHKDLRKFAKDKVNN